MKLTGLMTVYRRFLVVVPSGCQYTMKLDRLHRAYIDAAYLSLHPIGVIHGCQSIKAVGTGKLIVGCSLKLCSATPSVASYGMCHRNNLSQLHDSIMTDGLTMRLYQLNYITSYSLQICILQN